MRSRRWKATVDDVNNDCWGETGGSFFRCRLFLLATPTNYYTYSAAALQLIIIARDAEDCLALRLATMRNDSMRRGGKMLLLVAVKKCDGGDDDDDQRAGWHKKEEWKNNNTEKNKNKTKCVGKIVRRSREEEEELSVHTIMTR